MARRATVRTGKHRFMYVRRSPTGNPRTFLALIERIEGVPNSNTQVVGKDIVIGVPPGYSVDEVRTTIISGLTELGYDVHHGHRPRPTPLPVR